MTFANKVSCLGLTCAAFLLGCAQTVPKELADARVAYDRAAHGPAQEWAPADLHAARTSLDRAEQSFKDDGNSPNTRDLGYVALRDAQIAETRARMAAAEKKAQEAEILAQQQMAKELESTRAQLAGQSKDLAAAEGKAAAAMAELERAAAVKKDERGTVITLSGSVLFESGESDILAGAEPRLAQVADALTSRDPDSPIVVQGYTDSQGSKRLNDRLSKERAEAVRTFLISKGVAPDRIRAEGLGPERPVADNSSPEGRANNRRVEIVVGNESGSQQTGR